MPRSRARSRRSMPSRRSVKKSMTSGSTSRTSRRVARPPRGGRRRAGRGVTDPGTRCGSQPRVRRSGADRGSAPGDRLAVDLSAGRSRGHRRAVSPDEIPGRRARRPGGGLRRHPGGSTRCQGRGGPGRRNVRGAAPRSGRNERRDDRRGCMAGHVSLRVRHRPVARQGRGDPRRIPRRRRAGRAGPQSVPRRDRRGAHRAAAAPRPPDRTADGDSTRAADPLRRRPGGDPPVRCHGRDHGGAAAVDCKWGARGISADVLHQLDDARTHAADDDERLRAVLVIFDSVRSCTARLERQTAPLAGTEIVGLETLDRLAGTAS